MLLFIGGGVLALAAAAGGNLLGTAACGMERPAAGMSPSHALPTTGPRAKT